ncbi:MAG: tRNA (guanosine(37)-N1)-methyltransferase TrmD [Planctomycetes bacterium]|nr:tRNA (guanosine(37)-N1)-methyltransferase TrmD [Planctomycetota bacterium]
MRIDVLTIFPGILEGFLNESIVRIAREKGLLEVVLHDFRQFAEDKHRTVDDKPFGGGPGMVLKPEPIFACLEALIAKDQQPPRMLLMSPCGSTLTQKRMREFAKDERLVILCGRYEGYDERIKLGWPFEEVSIGDYVLSGGEVPAMVVIDSVARLLPGVLGHDLSALQDSFEGPLLDHPHYTRPADFRGMQVPAVLLSGDHSKVAAWRKQQALERTQVRRPDLLRGDARRGPDAGQV